MTSETNKILESLLRQQGITQFYPMEKPEKCELDMQLYAYIKEDVFFICDAELTSYSRKALNIPTDCPLVICQEIDTYAIRDIAKGKCFIISSDNIILDGEPTGFTEIGDDYFFISPTIDLPIQDHSIVGYLHEFKQNVQLDKPWIEYDIFKYSEKTDINEVPELPKIYLGACLYIKNVLKRNLRYLFSQKNKHVFFNTESHTFFLVYKTDGYGRCSALTYEANYIWITGTFFNFIKFDLKQLDIESETDYNNIVVTCNGSISEVKIISDSGYTETISTAYTPKVEYSNEYFIVQFFNSTYYHRMTFCLAINRYGKIVLSRSFDDQDIEINNNLISVRSDRDVDYSLIDCHGNDLAYVRSRDENRRYYYDDVKVEINIEKPSVYNDSDLLLRNEKQEEYESNGQIFRERNTETTYQGVIELHTGKTLVPINFSGVTTKICVEPFSEEYHKSKQVSIVWIDHYFGNEKSYYGMFVEDKLLIPIFYDHISFMSHDYDEKKHSFGHDEKETNYVLVKHNDSCGLYSSWGKKILPIEAQHIEALGQNQNTLYVKAYDFGDRIKLIYKDKIISGYDFLSAESIEGDDLSNREECVKVSSEEGYAFIYKGVLRTSFYDDITLRSCNILSDDNNEEFVFIVEHDGLQGLLNSNGEVVIPIECENIEVKRSFIKVDGIIYGEKMTPIINTQEYDIEDEAKNNGNYVFWYGNETEVILFGYDFWHTEVLKYDLNDLPDESDEIMGWKYNFNNNKFEFVEDEDYPYNDYPDDTDYERDTYYALGGDDYDAFRERGGSIDDMMDGMGF